MRVRVAPVRPVRGAAVPPVDDMAIGQDVTDAAWGTPRPFWTLGEESPLLVPGWGRPGSSSVTPELMLSLFKEVWLRFLGVKAALGAVGAVTGARPLSRGLRVRQGWPRATQHRRETPPTTPGCIPETAGFCFSCSLLLSLLSNQKLHLKAHSELRGEQRGQRLAGGGRRAGGVQRIWRAGGLLFMALRWWTQVSRLSPKPTELTSRSDPDVSPCVPMTSVGPSVSKISTWQVCGSAGGGGGCGWGALYCAQFCWGPKTALKNKVFLFFL